MKETGMEEDVGDELPQKESAGHRLWRETKFKRKGRTAREPVELLQHEGSNAGDNEGFNCRSPSSAEAEPGKS